MIHKLPSVPKLLQYMLYYFSSSINGYFEYELYYLKHTSTHHKIGCLPETDSKKLGRIWGICYH